MADGNDFEGMDLDALLGGDFESDAGGAPEGEPQGGEPETQQGEPQAGEGTAAPAPDATQAQEAQQQPEGWNPDGPGGPNGLRNALRESRQETQTLRQSEAALRQSLQAAEAQNAQLLTFLQQAQQPAAEPEAMPDPFEDPEGYAAAVERRVAAQYEERFSALERDRQAQVAHAELEKLEAQHPGARSLIDALDQAAPDLRGLPSAAKHAMAIGVQFLNPELRTALLQPHIDAAVKAALQQTTPQQPKAPPLLSSVPSAAAQDGGLPKDGITKADFDKHGLALLELME